MSINRLIALGGRGVKSPVERYIETKGQMERGRLRNVQEQAGLQGMDQNRLAMQATRQSMGIQEQEQKVKGLAAVGKYLDQFPEEQRATEFGKVDMNQFGLPSVPRDATYDKVKPAIEQSKLMIYGEPEQWQTRRRGDALTRVNQSTGKEERVLGASDATGVTKTMEIKPIGDSERRNMGKEFEIAGMLDKLVSNYDDKYSGFFSTNLSDLAVAAGKRGIKYEDMANYMTEYQEWKNLVRNSLFGSQLTAPEMREFERQAINPAFTATQNRKILKRQQELLARGKKRAKLALKARGWTDEMIEGFEGTYESDELTPDEMQELELRESIRQEPAPPQEPIGTVPRNAPVAP